MSMFIVQSGPIKRSLVAFSTRTVADVDDISPLLDPPPARTTRNPRAPALETDRNPRKKIGKETGGRGRGRGGGMNTKGNFQVSPKNEPFVINQSEIYI